MSKGYISDCRLTIEPSAKLVKFIENLEEYDELSESLMQIYNSQTDKKKKSLFKGEIKRDPLNNRDLEYLKDLNVGQEELPEILKSLKINYEEKDQEEEEVVNEESKSDHDKNESKSSKQILLTLNDLIFLSKMLSVRREKSEESIPYLHELLEGSKLILPQNDIIPRNPELEARCKKLREEQQNREYRSMTKDVDSLRRQMPEDTIAYQIKSINSQLIAVAQFIFSVVAGFAFGFLGVELIVGNLDFGFRLLLGIICALTIALAEIYFLAKKLNEIEDTVALEKNYKPKPKVNKNDGSQIIKQHED